MNLGYDRKEMVAEIQPGDTVHLTVVTPLAWRFTSGLQPLQQGPVAGVRSVDTIYMDPTIAATGWTAQATFSNIAIVALVILIVCAQPDIVNLFRRRPPVFPVNV
jgi:hypothetical protein